MPRFSTDQLWVIITSNNRGSYGAEVFTSREEADAECARRNKEREDNRADHLVSDLEDAIYERIREAESSALSDG